jgi:hypothetical protein
MEERSNKKIIVIGLIALLLLAIVGGFYLLMKKSGSSSITETIGKVLPFGTPTEDIPGGSIEGGDKSPGGGNGGGTTDGDVEPIFKRITDKPAAGLITLIREDSEFVRYVDRETGHIFEANIRSGENKELTNTTIPRIHEAFWGLNGDAVVMRYLEEDPYTKVDIIKTTLGYLSLPTEAGGDAVGTLLVGSDNLPDNITTVSLSPDGKKLFYLLRTTDGVSGSVVDLSTRITKEVFRNSFTEWTPEILDTNQIIFTTKPSAHIPGHAYRYDITTKTFERIVRNKAGLTTHTNATGERILYAENLIKNIVFGVYDQKGFASDEGETNHESVLSITTLPEKCAWRNGGSRTICAAFSFSPAYPMPDTWYRGSQVLIDTFWSVDTNTNEVAFLYDPQKEVNQSFDVITPVLSSSPSSPSPHSPPTTTSWLH